MPAACLGPLLLVRLAWSAAPVGYTDVTIDSTWEPAVWTDDLLLAGSPSVLVGPNDEHVLAAVGFAPSGGSVSERLVARRIAETQAKAAIARFIGSTVETTSTLETERTTVTTSDAKARLERVSAARKTFHELTTERAQQALRGVRVLGSWTTDGASAVLVGVDVPQP